MQHINLQSNLLSKLVVKLVQIKPIHDFTIVLLIQKTKLHFTQSDLYVECGGHSGRATPVPIPNTADKPVHVPYCTEVCEPSGTLDRCQTHPITITLLNSKTIFVNSKIALLDNF